MSEYAEGSKKPVVDETVAVTATIQQLQQKIQELEKYQLVSRGLLVEAKNALLNYRQGFTTKDVLKISNITHTLLNAVNTYLDARTPPDIKHREALITANEALFDFWRAQVSARFADVFGGIGPCGDADCTACNGRT